MAFPFDKGVAVCLNLGMTDKNFLKKEKVANLLFDLVKYLLTTLGAIFLLSDKPVSLEKAVVISTIALGVLITAVFITPKKED